MTHKLGHESTKTASLKEATATFSPRYLREKGTGCGDADRDFAVRGTFLPQGPTVKVQDQGALLECLGRRTLNSP